MNKGTKLFLALIILATLLVVFNRYQQYIINRNFVLNIDTVCSPDIEKCFTMDCSPADDPECDDTPYKKVEILEINAPKCLEEHNCSDFACDPGDILCSITFCSDNVLEDGEKCVESINNKI